MKFSDPNLQTNESSEHHIYWGTVTAVDPHKRTMSVKVELMENREFKNIAINTNFTVDGAGVHMMPTPQTTIVLLHESRAAPFRFYHIGYYINDSSRMISNKSGTKKGQIILQRYLNPGEVQIVSVARNEIFLSMDGSVLIKSGQGNFLTLSEYTNALEGSFSDLHFSMKDVDVTAGRVKRVKAADAATNNRPQVLRDENGTYYSEFSIGVGTQYDSATGALKPTVDPIYSTSTGAATGTISLASKVFDYKGDEERILSSATAFLQFLLKMSSNIKMGIDSTGAFYIVNSVTESYFKFSADQHLVNDVVKDDTELEVKIDKSLFKINTDGELLYTNEDPEDDTKTVSVACTKDGKVTITTSNGIEHKAGTTATEPSVLGDKLKTWLSTHTHPTGTGPSGPPKEVADLNDTLSPKVKNN